jgi:hypothetical protein
VLRLIEDILSDTATAVRLPPAPRMIFVTHGAIAIEGRRVDSGEAWSGEAAVTLTAGQEGANCWRWELVADENAAGLMTDGASSRPKLSAQLDTIPDGELLLRGDSVSFPPGGCAYRHVHQGPGIRCVIAGAIRIDTFGRATSYGPGGAWYESGPEPVFAQAAADRATRFIRVMILPRALIGKSSIRYVDEADKDKPRTQQYQLFADMPIGTASA